MLLWRTARICDRSNGRGGDGGRAAQWRLAAAPCLHFSRGGAFAADFFLLTAPCIQGACTSSSALGGECGADILQCLVCVRVCDDDWGGRGVGWRFAVFDDGVTGMRPGGRSAAAA